MLFQRISLSALCGALLWIASALSSEPSRSAPGLTETELKALFLLRLPQFVTWPEEGLGRTFHLPGVGTSRRPIHSRFILTYTDRSRLKNFTSA